MFLFDLGQAAVVQLDKFGLAWADPELASHDGKVLPWWKIVFAESSLDKYFGRHRRVPVKL